MDNNVPAPHAVLLTLAIVASLLSACAPAPTLPPAADTEQRWQAYQSRLQAIHAWRLVGRISLSAENESYHGSVHWTQDRDDYRIRLIAPLGQGSIELDGQGGEVTLHRADGEAVTARDPEALLLQTMGWRLPVRGLRYWVMGVPRPGATSDESRTRFDDKGRLEKLVQDGWEIEYRRYTEVDGVVLPSKVFLQRNRVKVRIIVENWALF